DEEESARGLLVKRLKGRTEITREERNRLAGYLSRKGYSLDVINRVIREFETSGSLE
ncbi:MAG: RecX family transcriptional regulator, partial [Clostridiales bacterium]|nr:RecX family transcriptional regulator [Clostridiales bacterium]